jgi:DNA-directed RNA polymerase subunit RPC12/RpoP
VTEPANDREAPPDIRCDFCGKRAERVRRVALDRDYERLQTPHAVQYACSDCSEAKERQRRATGTP